VIQASRSPQANSKIFRHVPRLRLLPACQLRNFARKNSGEKTGHSKIDNLFPHPRLHLGHGNLLQNKLSVLITMTAIHRASRSVSVSATALFIPFQRHPATLAILIRLIHNVERRLNLLALFLSSFAFQIIRDLGKLGEGNCVRAENG
jgi:hypothetical protein